MVKQDKYWPCQAAWLLGLPSGAVTGAVKRRGYWVCQAAPLLGLPSGVVTGAAKRRHCWTRQAAWLLGLPSGVVTGPAKRRRYWARQAASLLGPPSGVVTGPAKRRRYWARQAAPLLGPPRGGRGRSCPHRCAAIRQRDRLHFAAHCLRRRQPASDGVGEGVCRAERRRLGLFFLAWLSGVAVCGCFSAVVLRSGR